MTERELVLYAALGIEKAQQHANQQHTLRPKDERP